MAKVEQQRVAAPNDHEVVVFLIGMRFNKPWKIRQWLQVGTAMPRMLRELEANPELGMLHYEQWFGRTTILVQYWQSMEKLMRYSTSRDAEHLPAWVKFNRTIGSNGDVGIWHETYKVPAKHYECIYNNMPAFGLRKALGRLEATGEHHSALDRLGIDELERDEAPAQA